MITVAETLPSAQLELLEAVSHSGARAKNHRGRGNTSSIIGFITSLFSTPKWHKRNNYHSPRTTFGVKDVMDQGGNRS